MSDTPPHRWPAAALVIFGLALGVRLIPALALDNLMLYADSGEYDRIARHILSLGKYVPSAYRPPLYPYFVAGVMALAGLSMRAVLIAHAGLGALTALLTYWIGRRVNPSSAGLAALLVAFYPTLVIYTGLLVSENLYLPLFLVLVLTLQSVEAGGGLLWSAVAGVTGSLTALTRSAALLLAPVGVFLLGPPPLKQRLGRVLIAICAAVLVLAPWTYRNYRFFGALVPIDTNTGFNLMVGNNPQATGQLRLDVLRELEQEHFAGKSELERHREGLRVAGDFVLHHPFQWLALVPRKLGYLFGLEGRELLWAYSHDYFGAVRPWVLRLCLVGIVGGFPLLFLAALVGFALRPDRALGCVILYTVFVHVLSFGESRFHLPLVPLLAVLAASGWAVLRGEGWDALRGLGGGRLGLIAAVAVAAAAHWTAELIGYWPRLQILLAPGGHRAAFPY